MKSDNRKNIYMYLSVLIGSGSMMLLRIFDSSNTFSVILTFAGVTAFIYSIRHISSKKELMLVAGIVSVTYIVRIYGYTGDDLTDIIVGGLIGLIIFIVMFAERIFKKHEDCFWYTFIFPTAYLIIMYFSELIKINMPVRLDVYFSSFIVICQITAVLGIYSIDLLIALTASVLAFLIDHRLSRQSIILISIYGTVICSICCFGVIHIHNMNKEEAAKTDTVKLAYVTSPYYGDFIEAEDYNYTMQENIESFTSSVEDAAKQGSEILMFSEEAYVLDDTNENEWLSYAKNLAIKNHMHLLLPYEVTDTDESEGGKSINKIIWISNEGKILYDYTKHCLVPFVETFDYVKGEKYIEPFTIEVHGKNLEVATGICYDGDFDIFMSHMGKHIDLLLLPAWDWSVIAKEHYSVSRLRAIASETTTARSVYDGYNAIIDSAGHVLACNNTNEVGYAKVQVYNVPIY